MSYIPSNVGFDSVTNLPEEDYGVIEVRFGSNSPLLEVELNESQILQKNLFKKFLYTYFSDGILEGSTYRYDINNNLITFDNTTIFAGGNIFKVIGDRVPLPNPSSLILNFREVMRDYLYDLYPYGNLNLNRTNKNYFVDPRTGVVTSNRVILEFKLSYKHEEGFNSIVLGNVLNGEFQPTKTIPNIYNLARKDYRVNAGEGLSGGSTLDLNPTLTVKSSDGFIKVSSSGVGLDVLPKETLTLDNLSTAIPKLQALPDKEVALALDNFIEVLNLINSLSSDKVDKSTISDSIDSTSRVNVASSLAVNLVKKLADTAQSLADANKLNKINYTDIINDLVTGGARKVLSADMGVVLDKRISAISSGGVKSLYLNSEDYGERKFSGTLNAGSKDINIGQLIYNPTLFVGGVKIPNSSFTVDLATGHISLKAPYDHKIPWEWEVVDKYPYHIDFCYPTLNLLINSEAKNDIKINNVIKILGETQEDDGDHRLVKCESVARLNAVTLAPGKFLNEIPNTRPSKKLDRGLYDGTASDIVNLIHSYCPHRVGDILVTKNSSNPALTWLGTTWRKIENRFLFGSSTAGSLGGSSTMTLTPAHLPTHNHDISVTLGNSGNHHHQSGNHRHLVDNHTHSQSEHSHELHQQWYGGSYVNADNTDWIANGQADKAYNKKWTSRPLRSSTPPQLGGSTPYTDYQNPSTSTNGDHNHSVSALSSSVGGGQAFSILPPYETVYIWERLS